MPEPAFASSPPPAAARPRRAGALVVLAALAALVLAVATHAALRPLAPREAGILLEVLDVPAGDPAPRWQVALQRGWSWAAGCMERPSRALAVLAAASGIGILAFLATRRAWTAARVLVAFALLAASPLFWAGATAVGGAAAAFAAPLALAAAGAAAGLAPRGVAWTALVAAALLPAAAARLDPVRTAARSGVELDAARARRAAAALACPDPPSSKTAEIALAAAAVLALGLAAGAGRGRRGLADAGGLVLLFAAWSVARVGSVSTAPPRELALAALAPAALFAALPRARATLAARAVAAAVLLAAATTTAIVGAQTWRERPRPLAAADVGAPRLDRRAILDWTHGSVTPPAWLVLAGPARAVDRYYERVGHRTALASLMVPEELAAASLVSRAILEKPPVIVLVDGDAELRAALARRYEKLAMAHAPPGVDVLYFRR